MFIPTDIVVTVRQAKNLLIKAKGGINNAYATIELLKEKYATGAEKSLSPKWFTECSFSLPYGGVFSSKMIVIICLYHKHHSKLGLEPDEFLGQVQVPLSGLNYSDSHERTRWYSLIGKKKDSKKERGEVEITFRFLQSHKNPVIHEKKASPNTLRVLTSGLRSKLRRRSEDEDSGLGTLEGDNRSQGSGLGKGRSFENLSTMSLLDVDNHPFERSYRTASTNSSPGTIVSARGSARSLQYGNQLLPNKAMSVEVLHRPELKPTSSPLIHSESATGSGGAAAGVLVEKFKKKHSRNHSDSHLAFMMGQLKKDEKAKSSLCINGSHLYVPESKHSENNGVSALPDIKIRCSSMEDVSGKVKYKSKSSLPLNNSVSNSNRRHSVAALESTKQPDAAISTLYKPKNYYRLDVKELRKVSTIHEDTTSSYYTMTQEQLINSLLKQQQSMSSKDKYIRELEDYIDNLLLKVMTYSPSILEESVNVRKMLPDKNLTIF